jgi:uncharacterized membrane protein YqaE (UPF0057 family)
VSESRFAIKLPNFGEVRQKGFSDILLAQYLFLLGFHAGLLPCACLLNPESCILRLTRGHERDSLFQLTYGHGHSSAREGGFEIGPPVAWNWRKMQKRYYLDGTNRRSPLESTKASRKRS